MRNFYDNKFSISFPTILTIGRFFFIPVVVWGILKNSWGLAISAFVVAVITDIIDGALARLLNENTRLGAYLDPLADKVLIISSYFALMASGIPSYMMPRWFIILISIKEASLVLGALYLIFWSKKQIGEILQIKSSWTGKAAMTIQSLYLFILLLSLSTGHLATIKSFLFLQYLILAFVLLAWSQYTYTAFRYMFAFSKKIFIFFVIANFYNYLC